MKFTVIPKKPFGNFAILQNQVILYSFKLTYFDIKCSCPKIPESMRWIAQYLISYSKQSAVS